jgi:hypothetical protein
MKQVEAVSLQTSISGWPSLAVDVDGDPQYRPGAMAADGLEASAGCDWAAPFCAIVMVPIGAVAGAVITGIETLPKDEAHELNRVSAAVMTSHSLRTSLDNAMHDEALRQGLVVSHGNVDARVYIEVTRLLWDVSIGNNVAIHIVFHVKASVDGKRGKRNIRYRSERGTVPEWVDNNGQRIHETLATIMDEASQKVWQSILSRDG